jgi:tRNA guanosine-2'-O-methyltransferase
MEAELDCPIDTTTEKARNSIIVVASLVSKLHNLGGICRTSEIFNAELLVVSNLKVKDEMAFTGTSVTAEKWMPMREVKELDLIDYLTKMKADGYSLVGIEQATNSQSLDKFQFPKKALLLLGKEKEGIPASYLHLLDHIVEIPQFGVIRSLNVHVSASLILWEYTKQMVSAE